MDGRVANWVRLTMVALLAAPQLFTGLWAVMAPQSWFDNFPGLDPHLVAALPPFNHHLATDAGAGFLATGVALAAAAFWAHRSGVYVALLAYLAFAIPHVLYHTAHPSPELTSAEDLANVLLQGGGVGLAALLGWAARPHGNAPRTPVPVAKRQAG